jgi:hypothetical protein
MTFGVCYRMQIVHNQQEMEISSATGKNVQDELVFE